MKLVKKDWAGRKIAYHGGKLQIDSGGVIEIDDKEKDVISTLMNSGFKPMYVRAEKIETVPVEKKVEEKSVEKPVEKVEEKPVEKVMGSWKKKKGRVS